VERVVFVVNIKQLIWLMLKISDVSKMAVPHMQPLILKEAKVVSALLIKQKV